MRRLGIRFVVGLLLIACGQSAAVGPSPEESARSLGAATKLKEETQPDQAEDKWLRLLEASLEKTHESHEELLAVAERRPVDLIGALAQILLEEWSLQESNDVLKTPRLVFRPTVPLESLRKELPENIPAQTVIVRVRVSRYGLLEDFEFVRSSDFEVLNQGVRRTLPLLRFRPARDTTQYVEGESILTYRLGIH